MKTYIRGTNNKDENLLINKGIIRKSRNALNGKEEIGLSVSDPEHLENISNHFDHVYEVHGDEIGIGSDGEPLLDTKKLKFIKWIKKKAGLNNKMNNKPTFFNKDMAKRIAKKTAIGGAVGLGVKASGYASLSKHLDYNHPNSDEAHDYIHDKINEAKKSNSEIILDLDYLDKFYDHPNKRKLARKASNVLSHSARVGAGIGAAKGIYDEFKRYRKEMKEHEEMNKTAAARRPSVGTRARLPISKKPEYAYENFFARKDYNDIHFNSKNNYQNHILNQQPSRESQRSNIINPGLHEKSTTYSKSKEKASLTRKDPDYYSEKYIKDSVEKAKSDRVDKSRHIMSAINKSDVARSRDGYYRLPETNNSNGLSTGAKLGIGAGGAVIGALALRRYLKKRRQTKEQGEKK